MTCTEHARQEVSKPRRAEAQAGPEPETVLRLRSERVCTEMRGRVCWDGRMFRTHLYWDEGRFVRRCG
eukprot:317666-Rhodomonas_salina.1